MSSSNTDDAQPDLQAYDTAALSQQLLAILDPHPAVRDAVTGLLQPIIQAYLTLWKVFSEASARLAVLEVAGKSQSLTNAILTRFAETSEENDRLLQRWRGQQAGLEAAQRTIDEHTRALEEAHSLILVQEAELESNLAVIANLKTVATARTEAPKVTRHSAQESPYRGDHNQPPPSERSRLRSPADSVSTSGERQPARSEVRLATSARARGDEHDRSRHQSREHSSHRTMHAGSKRGREEQEHERRQRPDEKSRRRPTSRERDSDRLKTNTRNDEGSRGNKYADLREQMGSVRARERSRSPTGRQDDRNNRTTLHEPAASTVRTSNGREHSNQQSSKATTITTERVEKKSDSEAAKSTLVGRLGLPLANAGSGQQGLSILGRGRKQAEISK